MFTLILATLLSTATVYGECPEELEHSFRDVEESIRNIKEEVKYVNQRAQKRHFKVYLKSLKRDLKKMKRQMCHASEHDDLDTHTKQTDQTDLQLQDNLNVDLVKPDYSVPEQHFKDLLNSAGKVYNSADRLFYVEELAKQYCVTTAQSKSFLKLFNSSALQNEAITLLLPVIKDRENAHTLLEGVYSSTIRLRLHDLILNKKSDPRCVEHIPEFSELSDDEAKKLLKDQSRTYNTSDKIFVLKNAIHLKCLSVSQSKKFISSSYNTKDKYKVFELLLPVISNRAEAFKLLEIFQYSSYRANVKNKLRTVPQLKECQLESIHPYQKVSQ